MAHFDHLTPVIMSLSSHDPSGAGGIQADIETAASLGCHCTPVITALCAKDTRALKDIVATDTGLLIAQARAILEDMPVRVIKIGLLANVANVEAIHTILNDYPDIPVVLDPVTTIFDNEIMNASAVVNAMLTLLLPLTRIATPNLIEAQSLARRADTVDACAHEILETGCEYVLISEASHRSNHFENRLYGDRRLIKQYQWLQPEHSSQCMGAMLASSIAAYLAHGIRLEESVIQGQQFTWQAICAGRRLGMGDYIPNRMYWANKNHPGQ